MNSRVVVDREISTPRPSAPRNFSSRVYLKIASDTVRTGRFETYADLFDAVKTACARARVPYDSTAVSDAVLALDQQRRVGILQVDTRSMPAAACVERRDFGRGEAAVVLQGLLDTAGVAIGVRSWR